MSNTVSTHAEVHAYLAMVHPTKGTVTSPINPMKDLTLSARQRLSEDHPIYREDLQPSEQALILPPRPNTPTEIGTEADSDIEVIRNTADIPVYPAGEGRPTNAEGPYTSYQSEGRTNRWPRTNATGRLDEKEIDERDNELRPSVLGYVERIGRDRVDWGLMAHFLSTEHHKSFAEIALCFGYRPEDEHSSALAAKMLYDIYTMRRIPAERRLGPSGMGITDAAGPDSRALVISRYPPSSPDSFVSAT